MESYGLIIRHLRNLSKLSVQSTAQKIGRSSGWISAVENNTGACRLTETEFNRIVGLLDGAQYRAMFKTWVAGFKHHEQSLKTFDGAILKYIRVKKGLSLSKAKNLTGFSISYLSELETGLKSVSKELRDEIMKAYGYSPLSWKNLATDPIRSKAVPNKYKLEILLNHLHEKQIENLFLVAKSFLDPSVDKNNHQSNEI